MRRLLCLLALTLAAGCSSIENAWNSVTGASVERTFNAPIARVRPAFVSTLSQMGLPIGAMEVRGKSEVVKASKADLRVEVELERLSANSTRVRVSSGDQATASQVMRETEKRLTPG